MFFKKLFQPHKATKIAQVTPKKYEGECIRVAYRPVHYSDEDKFFYCPGMTLDEAEEMRAYYRAQNPFNPFRELVQDIFDLSDSARRAECLRFLNTLPEIMRNAMIEPDKIAQIGSSGFVIWTKAEYDD